MISTLGYIADAWILAMYAILARGGAERPFHWANAIGCLPIIIGELILGAYVPMVLTVAFGAIGWYGLYSSRIPKFRDAQEIAHQAVQSLHQAAHETHETEIVYSADGKTARWFCRCGAEGRPAAGQSVARLAREHIKRASK